MASTETAAELRLEAPGPGFWELDPVHFPRPVTRYWTEMHPEPFSRGFREFTANIASNDLVRVTGFMVRLSDIRKFNDGKGSRTNTTVLGAEAADVVGILERRPRVLGNELHPGYGQ